MHTRILNTIASWTAALGCLFALGCGTVSAAAATAPTPAAGATRSAAVPAAGAPTIVVLGDSLSAAYGIRPEQGWVALLQRRLREQGYGYRVVNASVSGETTGGGLARLPRTLKVHDPAIVIVELGGNDGLRGVPIDELKRNLDRLVQLSRDSGAQVLLAGMRIPTNYGPQYTERFFGTFGEVARTRKVPLVPFFLDRLHYDDRHFQADGIHPNAVAQPIMLDNVWPVLRPLLRTKAATG